MVAREGDSKKKEKRFGGKKSRKEVEVV